MIVALGLLLILIRIAALLLTAPIFGNRAVPMTMRLVLAAVIALAIAPLIFSSEETLTTIAGLSSHDLITLCLSEAMIGGLMGLGVLIVYSSAQMIGTVIGQMSGLQVDAFVGSENGFGQVPTSQLIGILTAAVFVLIDGPEMILASILDSFVSLPIGQSLGQRPVLTLLVDLLQQSFELTVRAIAPVVATVLGSTILVGVLSRTLPQLNLLQLGLSSNVAMMLLALFFTIGGCIWMVTDNAQFTLDLIQQRLPFLSIVEDPPV